MNVKPGAVLKPIINKFGTQVILDARLSDYTTAKIGGPADAMIVVTTREEMVESASILWKEKIPFHIIGNGSNILISDNGVRGVVILNQANKIVMNQGVNPPSIFVESGASLSSAAHQAVEYGLSGLEWAAFIPGTVGGAIYGNAGAHGSEIKTMLEMVEILQPGYIIEKWSSEQMEYCYRSSILKRAGIPAVILAAQLNLTLSTKDEVNRCMKEINEHRKKIQPPGASMGSMFKNPPGNYAARLIEECGLKGTRIGGAEVSPVHANFFINHSGTTASDTKQLIDLVKNAVLKDSGIELELEIELLGEW